MDKLKPCPYCGKIPKVIMMAQNWFVAECETYACNNYSYAQGSTKEMCADIWNLLVERADRKGRLK